MTKRFTWLMAAGFSIAVVASGSLLPMSGSGADAPPSAAVIAGYGKLPMTFEAHPDGADSTRSFVARGQNYSVSLQAGEAAFVLRAPPSEPCPNGRSRCGASRRLRMLLVHANHEAVGRGIGELAGRVNYLIGADPKAWRTDLRAFQRVEYRDVYAGVDVVYYGNQSQLEYDFVVHPAGNWRQIALRFEGADHMFVDAASGDLVIDVAGRTVRQRKPVAYQHIEGARHLVEASYVIGRGGEVAFHVVDYDPSLPLVIDPVVVYSTFLGGSELEFAGGIAVDAEGNAYVTGETDSSDFPTQGALQPTNVGTNAFVTKINPQGDAFIYSTYVGGSAADDGEDIAVDSAGNAYITGFTRSPDFPTVGAVQGKQAGTSDDAFVAKLNAAGNALVYSTYLGGSDDETGNAIAVDEAGNAYVAGQTPSFDFPVANAAQPRRGGFGDAFVTKINSAGTALVYSTFLGGEGSDVGGDLAIDRSGNAYVTGFTSSPDFPTLNPIAGAARGDTEAFVTKLDAAGSALVYSTTLGGSDHEDARSIAVDGSGSAYVAGATASRDFPLLNPIQSGPGEGTSLNDAFVAKLTPAGNALVYSTYLGGRGPDVANAIAVDSSGAVYVGGVTASPDFPVFAPVQSSTDDEDGDAYLTKIAPDGKSFVYSTYFGGIEADGVFGLALDSSGSVYLSGRTHSFDFPTRNAAQRRHAREGDLFIAKFAEGSGGPKVEKRLVNVSTRLGVSTGENVLIGGFIVTGTTPKLIAVRAIGPSLAERGLSGALENPTLEIYRGETPLATNDDWRDSQAAEIERTGLAPEHERESMVLATLEPGNYTAVLRGKNDTTGVGLVEVYDAESGAMEARVANISSRGFLRSGDNDVMIGGFFVLGGGARARIVVRAIGPSLEQTGVRGALADPTLELRNSDGDQLLANDDWKESQQWEIEAAGIPPGDERESALVATLGAGSYTAIVRGKGESIGVGLVEIYNVQ